MYYVPKLRHNLISIGKLLQKGYKFYFENDACEILDSHRTLIAKFQMTQNKMFPLRLKNNLSVAFKAVLSYQSWLWHLMFGD